MEITKLAGAIALALLLVAGAGTAHAQLPTCSGIGQCTGTFECGEGGVDCRVDLYGLGVVDNPTPAPGDSAGGSYLIVPEAVNPLKHSLADFAAGGPADGSSYIYSKGTGLPGDDRCGTERGFSSMLGQVRLREQIGCIPAEWDPDTFDPSDAATNPPASCPVEVATDVDGVGGNPGDVAAGLLPTLFGAPRTTVTTIFSPDGMGGFINLGPIFIATSTAGGLSAVGARFVTPVGHRLGDAVEFIRWFSVWNGGGSSGLCCNDNLGGAACEGANLSAYPALTDTSPLAFETRNMAVWVFEGGPGTPFRQDLDFVPLGTNRQGHCVNDRTVGCDEDDADESGNECVTFGVGGACDLRDGGWRFQPNDVLGTGDPNGNTCNTAPFIFNGTPNENCSIAVFYPENGDPGPDCGVSNFLSSLRPDLDCDGVEDTAVDLCPFFSEVDPFIDTNGDGRGDQCQPGDATQDGQLNVSDILQANTFIFVDPGEGTVTQGNDRLTNPTCDTNDDDACNVADILAINGDLFTPPVPVVGTNMRHPAVCGDGVQQRSLTDPEECDDGNTVAGDGCDASCQLEP